MVFFLTTKEAGSSLSIIQSKYDKTIVRTVKLDVVFVLAASSFFDRGGQDILKNRSKITSSFAIQYSPSAPIQSGGNDIVIIACLTFA